MRVWCLYVSAGIFPFKLTFRYRESATKMIITGGIIGTLVVAMYLPIFHLGDAMSGMG